MTHLVIGACAVYALSESSVGANSILVFVVFSSVMSDVVAYFLGNYLGSHKLPEKLNNRKSWEGVAGQIFGALAGALIVNRYFISAHQTYLLAVIVGLGAAYGDLLNSFAKRKLGIKDWGSAIPGHGGFADRFSSMYGSALFAILFLII